MDIEKSVDQAAIKVGGGVVAGVAAGVLNAAQATQIHNAKMHPMLFNASSKFAHSATKALRQHKGASSALAAGAVAVVHGAGAAAAATVAMPALAVGAAAWGIFKLAKHLVNSD